MVCKKNQAFSEYINQALANTIFVTVKFIDVGPNKMYAAHNLKQTVWKKTSTLQNINNTVLKQWGVTSAYTVRLW